MSNCCPTEGVLSADITNPTELQAAFERVRAEAGEPDGSSTPRASMDLNSPGGNAGGGFHPGFSGQPVRHVPGESAFSSAVERTQPDVIVSSELAPLHPLPITGIYAITKTAVLDF